MIERKKQYQYEYMTQQVIKDAKNELENENLTTEQVVEYILGNYVVHKYGENPKRTLLNRLNLLWVYPIALLCIPFQYLLTGNTGVTRNSRIGRIMDKLVRFER